MKAILDLDGVHVNFIDSALRTHGRENPYLDPANRGEWDVVRLLGMKAADFWRPLDRIAWWEHLPWTQHGQRLFEFLCLAFGRRNLEIATVMGRRFDYRGYAGVSGASAMGKANWISREMGVDLAIHILSCHEKKAMLYLPDGLLIDDNEYTITRRKELGGPAILWPAPWNSLWRLADEPFEYLVGEVKQYREIAETADWGQLSLVGQST